MSVSTFSAAETVVRPASGASDLKRLPMQTVVILGAGQVAGALAAELAPRGIQITAVSRSGKSHTPLPANVAVIAADLTDPAAVARVTAGADVVFATAQPDYTKWPEFFSPLMQSILEGLSHSGARLVFVDNLYLYGPTGGAPISERSPHNGHGAKGRTRAAIAQMVLDAHRQGKVMATIGRASDYYGPGVTDAAISAAFFEAVLAGKTGDLLGNIDLPHTYSYLPDFARALVTLAEYEVAYGRAWHAPNAETITTRQFVGYVEKALGRPVKVRVAGKLMVYMMGLFIPILREFPELMYEFDAPYVVDDGDFRRTFAATGIHTTPWDEGVAATVAWYQARAAKR